MNCDSLTPSLNKTYGNQKFGYALDKQTEEMPWAFSISHNLFDESNKIKMLHWA